MKVDPKNLLLVEFDPEAAILDAQARGKRIKNPVIPQFQIAGKIAEFNSDVVRQVSGVDLDLILGNRHTDADTSAGFSKGNSSSSIALSLHLVDYKTSVIVPGVAVYNRIDVIEYSKDYSIGVFVSGSGFGASGMINIRTNGLSEAVFHLGGCPTIGIMKFIPQYMVYI